MLDIVNKARGFAEKHHEGQARKYSGKPYIDHLKAVVGKLTLNCLDHEILAAGWLHDVVEDCNVTEEDLRKIFPDTVVDYVMEVTNPSIKFPSMRRKDRKAADFAHIAHASEQGQLIKVCDRISNLKDLINDNSPADFRKLYAKESLALASVLKRAPGELLAELVGLAYKLLFLENV
jgi:(p)ppGpp synthase/HD superfamily hydrolase